MIEIMFIYTDRFTIILGIDKFELFVKHAVIMKSKIKNDWFPLQTQFKMAFKFEMIWAC